MAYLGDQACGEVGFSVAAQHQLRLVIGEPAHGGNDDITLRRPAAVDGAETGTGARRDVFHGEAVETPFPKELDRRRKDRLVQGRVQGPPGAAPRARVCAPRVDLIVRQAPPTCSRPLLAAMDRTGMARPEVAGSRQSDAATTAAVGG